MRLPETLTWANESFTTGLMDVVVFVALAWILWAGRRHSIRKAKTALPMLKVGTFLGTAVVLFEMTLVVSAFVFVPHVPAHSPPWKEATTLATILVAATPTAVIIVLVSLGLQCWGGLALAYWVQVISKVILLNSLCGSQKTGDATGTRKRTTIAVLDPVSFKWADLLMTFINWRGLI